MMTHTNRFVVGTKELIVSDPGDGLEVRCCRVRVVQHTTYDLVHVTDDRILLHQLTLTTSGCLPVLQVL